MKRSIHIPWAFSLITMLCSVQCSKASQHPLPGKITASSYSPAVPVLKGLEVNPVVRIVVSIPEGHSAQRYRQVEAALQADVLTDLQRIDVYLTGAEHFSASRRIGTALPQPGKFRIPIDVDLQPGVHFIWLSVTLKGNARVGPGLELRGRALEDAGGKSLLIDQGNAVYKKRTGVAVRKAGDNGVDTYRIPGIVRTDKGTLLAVYDIRYNNSRDLPGNIDVGLSRSTDGGHSWEPMKVIMDMGDPHENNGVGDPAILFDPETHKVLVVALWSKGNRSIAGSMPGLSPDSTGQLVITSSADDGQHWTKPESITPQVKNPAWHLFFNGPGNGIAMQDGKLVFAAQYWDEKKMPHSTIVYSKDHGNTWQGLIRGPKSNTTESQVVETTPGTLLLNMRDNRGGFRSVATTSDLGKTWTEHASSFSALPDPVCMGSLIKARVKVKGTMRDVLFFSNPNTSSGRYNITVKASVDLGETWAPVNRLLVDERNCYGYSSLVPIDEDHIGLLYEGTKELYFVRLSVAEIIQ